MNSNGYSSKNDRDHHGYGLSNIKATVAKNDGMLKAESSEREFTLSIMIPRS
jgi:sensor histidine kinase regulating citrate/malate metabolism